MRGAVSGSLVVSLSMRYVPRMVSLVVASRAEVTARREDSRFGVAGGCLVSSLHYLIVSIVVATRAELTAIREESCFGVAGGLLIRFRRQQSGNCIACKCLCFGDRVMKLIRRKTQ